MRFFNDVFKKKMIVAGLGVTHKPLDLKQHAEKGRTQAQIS